MIDRTHDLPVKRQAELVGISRGSVYYLPKPVSAADLTLMRAIDELHLEYPFAGARMLRDMLKARGFEVGRKHVATLMRRMGIEALYRKPTTSKRHPQHLIYPYLLRKPGDRAREPGLGDGHHVHPDGARLRVPGRDHRLAQPQGAGLGRVDLDGGRLLRARARSGAGTPRQARRSSTRTRAASSRACCSPGG